MHRRMGETKSFLMAWLGLIFPSAAAASLKFSATYLRGSLLEADLGEGRIGIAVRVHQARNDCASG